MQALLDEIDALEGEIEARHPRTQKRLVFLSLWIIGGALASGIFEGVGWDVIALVAVLLTAGVVLPLVQVRRLQRRRDRLLGDLDDPSRSAEALPPKGELGQSEEPAGGTA